jgi:uncharacterized protein with ParB-like and HNH nuclease domain
MAKTLSAHEQPIQKVFSDEYVFRIPDYQRPYSWTTDHAKDLLGDLLSTVEANPGAVSDMPTYFLGSVVLIKKEDNPKADVVDGQQRLTTLTLLLAAIRSNIASESKAELTEFLYAKGNALRGTQDRFRLALRQRDADFFQRYVQQDGGFSELLTLQKELVDSQLRLRDNAKLFQTELDRMNEEKKVILAQFILQRCHLVVVSTADEDSAYRIFSVLNSRGLDLSATDILKASIIGGIQEYKRDKYTEKWEDAEENLGRSDFNNLFSHIRTVFRKTKAKETLLKEFEAHVPAIKTPIKFIDEVLLPMVDVYDKLTTADHPDSNIKNKLNDRLRCLNRLEFKDWIPPLLSFATREKEYDAAAFVAFACNIERLAYHMMTTKKNANDRIDRFAKVMTEIESGENLASETSALQLTKKEKQDFYNCLDGSIYENLSSKASTALMLCLDTLLSDGGAHYDYEVITIEHILPQCPKIGSKWLEWFPNPNELMSTVHRLGNLALLTRKKNIQVSNSEFDRKKQFYFQRGEVVPFALTTQVIHEVEWTPAVVEARQTKLMEKLETHWRLNDRKKE